MGSPKEEDSERGTPQRENQEKGVARVHHVQSLVMSFLPKISQVAPRFVNPERIARLACTAIGRDEKLAACTQRSLIGSLLECAALGLEPGTAGQAWLVPFWNGKQSVNEATLIIGYRGLATLAWRSERVASMKAEVVREKDDFVYEIDTSVQGLGLSRLRHRRPAGTEYGSVIAAYAALRTTFGGVMDDIMERADLDRIRDMSRAKDSGPWKTHPEEMYRKTVCRRLLKYAPISTELGRAVDLDEAGDRGEQVALIADGMTIDLPAEPVEAPRAALPSEPEQGERPMGRGKRRRSAPEEPAEASAAAAPTAAPQEAHSAAEPQRPDQPPAPATDRPADGRQGAAANAIKCEETCCNRLATSTWGDAHVAACEDHGPDFGRRNEQARRL